MPKNNDYTTGNLLDFPYHQNHYKRIAIEKSRQTNTSIPHHVNFTGKLEEDDGAVMSFTAEKQPENTLKFKFINYYKII